MSKTKEEANVAFSTLIEAVDLAMKGRFPTGLDALDTHIQVRTALETISGLLGEVYNEPEVTKEEESK